MSCRGSAVLTPPATVMPNCATAVGSDATVRQVSVAGLYSSTVFDRRRGVGCAGVPADGVDPEAAAGLHGRGPERMARREAG